MLLAAGVDKIGLCQALERFHGPVAEVYTIGFLQMFNGKHNPKGM